MEIKTYGEPDEDSTAQRLLMDKLKEAQAKGLGVQYVVLHQRKPIDARMCQNPGSLTVQAVLSNNTVVTVRQDHKNGPARVIS